MSNHQIIGHISIGVRNITLSRQFYTAIFAPLGLSLVYESPPDHKILVLGYGPDPDHEAVNIFQDGDDASAPGRGSHIAFNATGRAAVEMFHAAGIANGGVCDGPPGVRHQYGPRYFAAFLIDPDGWRLEAVYQK
jgi:catechol 2,3-dioxygenase-like lactoylglutathione lyase family enzyme